MSCQGTVVKIPPFIGQLLTAVAECRVMSN